MRILMRADIRLQCEYGVHVFAIKVHPRINNRTDDWRAASVRKSGGDFVCFAALQQLHNPRSFGSPPFPPAPRGAWLGWSVPLHSSSASGLIPRARAHSVCHSQPLLWLAISKKSMWGSIKTRVKSCFFNWELSKAMRACGWYETHAHNTRKKGTKMPALIPVHLSFVRVWKVPSLIGFVGWWEIFFSIIMKLYK